MAYVLAPKAQTLVPYDPTPGEYRVRLDANESFLLPTDTDREKMAEAAAAVALNRYPDPRAAGVCDAFARLYGVKPELVTAGNGSDELISVILSTFLQKGEPMLTVAPDFSMYRFYSAITENPCLVLDKGTDLRIDVDTVIRTIREQGVRLFIFSNPCNPTSLGLNRDSVRRLLRETDALIVLDEAYMDFWDQSLLGEVEQYDNLILLRTCSKALGMAAIRLGFAVACPALTRVLQAAKSPYNVNAVTQAMAEVVLRNPVYHDVYRDLLLQSRDMLYTGLQALEKDGLLQVYETCTNFAYVRTPHARWLFDELADRGILVRCFGGEHLRITAGTQAENAEVLASIGFLLRNRESILKEENP